MTKLTDKQLIGMMDDKIIDHFSGNWDYSNEELDRLINIWHRMQILFDLHSRKALIIKTEYEQEIK